MDHWKHIWLVSKGSIPVLTQWVKDPALPWAVVQVEDMAQILCCCGCGIGQQLWLWFNPSQRTCICCKYSPKRQKKRKKPSWNICSNYWIFQLAFFYSFALTLCYLDKLILPSFHWSLVNFSLLLSLLLSLLPTEEVIITYLFDYSNMKFSYLSISLNT